jgi:cobalt/nickel transport system permease protein
MRHGVNRRRIVFASLLGCVLTLQLGAFSVTLETLASGITELPFAVFVGLMQPIHLAIGLVEGLITAAVLVFVYEARPTLLQCYDGAVENAGKLSTGKTVGILGAAALVIGGLLSLVASEYPDGLEWSLQNITGSTELDASGSLYNAAAAAQEKLSLLPDYALPGSDSAVGTSISGIVGALVVVVLCVAVCYGLKLFKKKRGRG